MRKCLAILLFLSPVPTILAQQQDNQTYNFGLTDDTLLSPGRRNAYGAGVDADATGRPFYWAPKNDTQSQRQSYPDATLQVKPDAYGLGVGIDQYGRPVESRTGQ